jgi:hypothetical protein
MSRPPWESRTATIQVQAIGADSNLIRLVFALHRKFSKTLGFLTREAFIDQAAKGFLLGAVDDNGDLVGYALYYVPRREIRLTHLCVDTVHRGNGIARKLVDELCGRHPVRCAQSPRRMLSASRNNSRCSLGSSIRADVCGHLLPTFSSFLSLRIVGSERLFSAFRPAI